MKIFFTAIGLLLVISGSAQTTASAIPNNVRATNTLHDLRSLSPSEVLYGIPLPPKTLIGDVYLNQHWQAANILLYTKETLLEGYPLRYDVFRDELEVKSISGIKVLEGRRVKSFVWIDSVSNTPEYFINAAAYKSSQDEKLIGFFSVLVDGPMPLFKKTTAYIKEADYNVQFNMGSRDDKVVKKDVLYYALAGVVYKVPRKQKKLLAIFSEHGELMKEYLKTNTPDLSEESDMKKVFTYFNSLK